MPIIESLPVSGWVAHGGFSRIRSAWKSPIGSLLLITDPNTAGPGIVMRCQFSGETPNAQDPARIADPLLAVLEGSQAGSLIYPEMVPGQEIPAIDVSKLAELHIQPAPAAVLGRPVPGLVVTDENDLLYMFAKRAPLPDRPAANLGGYIRLSPLSGSSPGVIVNLTPRYVVGRLVIKDARRSAENV